MDTKSPNIDCPKCGGESIKDLYRDLWICVNPKCTVCDIFLFECNLCSFSVHETSPPTTNRMNIHKRWHTNCRKEKRNNTEGIVQWKSTMGN